MVYYITDMTKKILVINPFGIGDVLFSTPLITAIKEKYPLSYIAYICNIRAREAIETNPDIADIFVFERDEYRRLWKSSKLACIRKFLSFWKDIRNKGFDIAIDLSMGKEYSFLCWFVGIKERRGLDYKKRGKFLTHKVFIKGFTDKPVADYFLDVVGIHKRFPTVLIPKNYDIEYIDDFLRNNGLQQGAIIGIAPGGGAAFGKNKAYYKRWPWQHFSDLASALIEKDLKPVLLWGPGEEALILNIKRSVGNGIIAAPITSIRQMACLMKRCRLVICNDGGMLHIAVSQGIPTISIFGPTDETVYGPYPPDKKHIVIKSNVNCRPCYKFFRLPDCDDRKCMTDISVQDVLTKLKEIK